MTGTPRAADTSVTFELADRRGRLATVRLAQEIGLPEPLDLARAGGTWRLQIPRPDVDRLEYLFDIADHNGNRTTILDPGNPRRAPGAFGDKSVAEFSGYRAPVWLATEPVPASQTPLSVDAPALAGELRLLLWSPDSLDEVAPAPLLVVHDGPEFAGLGGFTHYLGACVATAALPPLRAALLDPGDRNDWYAANPAYADTLGALVRDTVRNALPVTTTIGIGASLGALAMLHAHRTQAGLFDALMLQSGSFFTPELDAQESGFTGYPAITEFVASVLSTTWDRHPVPTVFTCGTVEENLANNQAMAAALRRLGYPTTEATVRDAHNFTAWRDALHPYLTELVTTAVAAHAA